MFRKLALALLAPLLFVACATEADQADVITADASGRDLIATLRSAPDLAAEAGSARFEMVFSIDLPEGATEMRAVGAYSGDRMRMEMDLGSMLSGLAEASGEALPPGMDEPMEMVIDGDTTYLRMPMLDMLTGTDGWLSATAADLGDAGAAFGLGGTATSPTQILETLRGVADDVEEVGREEIRGVSTTHHRATLDLERVLDSIPKEQRAQMEDQLGSLDGSDAGSVPLDVWIGDDGLPRRIVMAFHNMGAAMALPGSATMTMELFDYGDDVDVEVPPPSEVTPLADVMPGMGSALG